MFVCCIEFYLSSAHQPSAMAAVASHAGAKRKRGDNVQNVPKKMKKTDSDDGESPTPDTEGASGLEISKISTKHTKKERKTNRSSRIHSLKKLLSRDTLPSNVRQDKERELSALEYDQAKHKSRKQDKKILEKYHYVRFVERQKAEKRLKQLQKSLQDEEDEGKSRIDQDIHVMEVNRNYAIYAPLHEKYVSVFVKSKGKKTKDATEESKDRPEMWYEVEAAMQEGQSALEALRDGKRRLNLKDTEAVQSQKTLTDVKLKLRTKKNNSNGKQLDQQREDITTGQIVESDASEDDMSDGGFFQR